MKPSIQDRPYIGEMFDVETEFSDFTEQVGSPVDTLKQIKFDIGLGDSPSGLVNLSSNGDITTLKKGPYGFKSRYRLARTDSSGGVSHVFFLIQTSLDGGTTWQLIGNSVCVNLTSVSEDVLFFDFATVFLQKGQMLRSIFTRSSTGKSDGNLEPEVPSATLQALGVQTAPSAQLTVYKSRDFKY